MMSDFFWIQTDNEQELYMIPNSLLSQVSDTPIMENLRPVFSRHISKDERFAFRFRMFIWQREISFPMEWSGTLFCKISMRESSK